MNKKKKSAAKAAAAVAAIILLIIAAVKITPADLKCTWLGTRLYQGDRIKVNLYIAVDGKSAEISKNDTMTYKIKKGDGCYTISHRANDYDNYEYSLLINEKIPLNLCGNHWNWWQITRSNLYIDIDTKAKTYTYYEEYSYTEENPYYHIEEGKEKKEIINGIDSIYEYFGPKG